MEWLSFCSSRIYTTKIQEEEWQVQKVINTLAGVFKLTHHNLFKLKKYEGLVHNEEQEIGDINQMVYTSKNIGKFDNIKQLNKSVLNKTNENYTYWGTC